MSKKSVLCCFRCKLQKIDCLESQLPLWKQLLHMFRYEDLCVKTREIAEQIYKFVGINMTAEMSQWISTNTKVRFWLPLHIKYLRSNAQAAFCGGRLANQICNSLFVIKLLGSQRFHPLMARKGDVKPLSSACLHYCLFRPVFSCLNFECNQRKI